MGDYAEGAVGHLPVSDSEGFPPLGFVQEGGVCVHSSDLASPCYQAHGLPSFLARPAAAGEGRGVLV